jgi:hypothetical protein
MVCLLLQVGPLALTAQQALLVLLEQPEPLALMEALVPLGQLVLLV